MNTTTLKHLLLDKLKTEMNIPSDIKLARALDVPPPTISKIRNRVLGVSDTMLIKIHKFTKWPVEKIEELRDADNPVITTTQEQQNGNEQKDKLSTEDDSPGS